MAASQRAAVLAANVASHKRKRGNQKRVALWARSSKQQTRQNSEVSLDDDESGSEEEDELAPTLTVNNSELRRNPKRPLRKESLSDSSGRDTSAKSGTDGISALLHDYSSNSGKSDARGYLYSPETKHFAWKLYTLCGQRALDVVSKEFKLPSRQTLESYNPSNFNRSDLRNASLIVPRIRQWFRSIGWLTQDDNPRCILACDALSFKPAVTINGTQIEGLDITDFDMDQALLNSITTNAHEFMNFVEGHWNSVLQSAFVYQIQPLNPKLPTLILFASARPDGKARKGELDLLTDLRDICRREHIIVGAFVTDGDSGYDPAHEIQIQENLKRLRYYDLEESLYYRYRACSDVLHLLKRVRYRMLKSPPMVVGLEVTSPELNLGELKTLFKGFVPNVVFSDDPITKMHDSLPMVLFRFESLLKLDEGGQLAWLAYFFPWVLLNEAMSHQDVSTLCRFEWLEIAFYYLGWCLETYYGEGAPERHGMKQSSSQKEDGSRRYLFDRKLLVHAINTIATLVHEIKIAKGPISLQRISTVPVEKLFGVTRLHAGTHQTLAGIMRTMEINQALKVMYVNEEVRKRHLAYGETVQVKQGEEPFAWPAKELAEAMLLFVRFPLRCFWLPPEAEPARMMTYFLRELIPTFTTTKLPEPERVLSLWQATLGVAVSVRQVMLSAKERTGRAVRVARPKDDIELHIGHLLGMNPTVPILRVIVDQVCEMTGVRFDSTKSLARSKRDEILAWMRAVWNDIRWAVDGFAAGQRRIHMQ
jgi:hypothetical protein